MYTAELLTERVGAGEGERKRKGKERGERKRKEGREERKRKEGREERKRNREKQRKRRKNINFNYSDTCTYMYVLKYFLHMYFSKILKILSWHATVSSTTFNLQAHACT